LSTNRIVSIISLKSFHQDCARVARTIVIPKGETEEQVPLDAQERMAAASKADFRIANERFRWVSAYLEGDKQQVRQAPVSERTVRRWAQAYQAAALHYRTGYVGLLPKTSQRGNRHAKAPEEAQALLLSFITDGYETSREAPAWEVYLAYQRACEEKQIVALSYRTFYRQIKQRAGYEQTKAREASKGRLCPRTLDFRADLHNAATWQPPFCHCPS
jgi:putative transposase